MKKRYRILGAAALTAIGLMSGTTAGYGAVYVSDSLYDWEANADQDGDSAGNRDSSGRGLVREQSGPGEVYDTQEDQVLQVEESLSGPTVTQVSLGERYHEEYETYEESIGGLFFFYSNVANGGITDKEVVLDIPGNISCTAEKDGNSFAYMPGQAISGYGTYVLRLTVVEDTSLPFSEQKEYRAVFRFRIQEKPPKETQEKTEGENSAGGNFGYSSGSPAGGQGSESQARSLMEEDFPEGSGEDGSGEAQTGEELSLESQPGQEPSQEDQSGGDLSLENQPGEDPSPEVRPGEGQELPGDSRTDGSQRGNLSGAGSGEAVSAGDGEGYGMMGGYSPRTQSYDQFTGRYQVTFENGRTLTSTVPEGYKGPGAVEVSVSEGAVGLYRDDQPLEYVPGAILTEPGNYRLDIDGQTWSFSIGEYVNTMDHYPAPRNMKFTAVTFNGETRPLSQGRYVDMEEDGRYQIVMEGQAGENIEVVLEKDTVPPEVLVTAKGGMAQIQYLSEDIDKVTLEKDGEEPRVFSGYSVTSPGSYRLTVQDRAGNVSDYDFTLKFHVNRYGVMAVVLMILVIAGAAGFAVHVKRTVKVR